MVPSALLPLLAAFIGGPTHDLLMTKFASVYVNTCKVVHRGSTCMSIFVACRHAFKPVAIYTVRTSDSAKTRRLLFLLGYHVDFP